MMDNDFLSNRVGESLRALAAADRSKEAPPEVEMRVMAAFRRRRRFRALGNAVSVVAAAAVVLAFGISFRMHRHPETQVTRKPAALPATTSPTDLPVPKPVVSAVKTIPEPAPRAILQERPETQETVTDFIPLLDPAPPFERGELLRVNLPASAMRAVGIPVAEDHLLDRVQADVLVGEEGLPRAIRFVSFDGR